MESSYYIRMHGSSSENINDTMNLLYNEKFTLVSLIFEFKS